MTACPHEGAPAACPLCSIGEDFTLAARSSLDALRRLMAEAQGLHGLMIDLTYARQCVLHREWDLARNRLHQRNIDQGYLCAATGLLGSICRCTACRERRSVPCEVIP